MTKSRHLQMEVEQFQKQIRLELPVLFLKDVSFFPCDNVDTVIAEELTLLAVKVVCDSVLQCVCVCVCVCVSMRERDFGHDTPSDYHKTPSACVTLSCLFIHIVCVCV